MLQQSLIRIIVSNPITDSQVLHPNTNWCGEGRPAAALSQRFKSQIDRQLVVGQEENLSNEVSHSSSAEWLHIPGSVDAHPVGAFEELDPVGAHHPRVSYPVEVRVRGLHLRTMRRRTRTYRITVSWAIQNSPARPRPLASEDMERTSGGKGSSSCGGSINLSGGVSSRSSAASAIVGGAGGGACRRGRPARSGRGSLRPTVRRSVLRRDAGGSGEGKRSAQAVAVAVGGAMAGRRGRREAQHSAAGRVDSLTRRYLLELGSEHASTPSRCERVILLLGSFLRCKLANPNSKLAKHQCSSPKSGNRPRCGKAATTLTQP